MLQMAEFTGEYFNKNFHETFVRLSFSIKKTVHPDIEN